MLDSKRTFKTKVRSPWTVSEILLTSAVICIYMSNILKTTNVAILTKIILESFYRAKGTFKEKTLKETIYFLRAVEFWPTFDIQIDITLAIFWEKLQNQTF